MNLEGLDYNTARPQLLMRAYGRQVQEMVEHALELTDREERQQCAESIIACMRRLTPNNGRKKAEIVHTLWNHLAVMSNFQLDIDYPVAIIDKEGLHAPPSSVPYPQQQVDARHYGTLIMQALEELKAMPEGECRTALLRQTGHRMRRCLQQWSTGHVTNEKLVSDIDRYTDGVLTEEAARLFPIHREDKRN